MTVNEQNVTRKIQLLGTPRVFFTAPWEPTVERRGDALGLRAVTDQFAESVAPYLSNRIQDGRWVTILAWCIARSHDVYMASGGRRPETRAQQRDRYAWLRPLELMWVARTIGLDQDGWRKRQLPGRRRVKRWYMDDARRSDYFGMSTDQFKAYRQAGMYGGLRLAFRHWPGLTIAGDGWTPGPQTHALAKWLDAKLGTARPPWALGGGDVEDGVKRVRSAKSGGAREHAWWLRHWIAFDQGSRTAVSNTLPCIRTNHSILPEARLLKPIIFGADDAGRRRLRIARVLASIKAKEHLDFCIGLARRIPEDPTIALLPRFSRLADAGMEAMDLIVQAIGEQGSTSLAQVVRLPQARGVCAELHDAAMAWPRGQMHVRHSESADQFADLFKNPTPTHCIAALLEHHETRGGGLRWFFLRKGLIEAGVATRTGASRYRFRFWALCRLAAQCGVIGGMPTGLIDMEFDEVDAPEETQND